MSHLPAINDRYDRSDHGPEFRWCRACRSNVAVADLVANDACCPGCDYLADAQAGIRGAL